MYMYYLLLKFKRFEGAEVVGTLGAEKIYYYYYI